MKSFTSILFTLLLMFIASAYGNDEVNLYLNPFHDAVPYKTISMQEFDTLGPQALIINGQESLEWFWVDYPGTFEGFVAASAIQKNLQVKPQTLIHLSQDTDSAILGTVTETTPIDILDLGEVWASVQYTGTAAMYIKSAGPIEEEIPIQQLTAEEFNIPQAPIIHENASPIEKEIPIQTFTTETVSSSQNSIPYESSPPIEDDGIIIIEEAEAPIEQPLSLDTFEPPSVKQQTVAVGSKSLGKDTPRFFEGKLKKRFNMNFYFFKFSEYDYILRTRNGEKLAYVNVRNLFLENPIDTYIDKNVMIKGTAEATNTRTPLLIHALSISLK